jgi:hypothetical protein
MSRIVNSIGVTKRQPKNELAADLAEVNDDQLGALSNILSIRDIEITALLNLVVDNASEIASLSNEYYPFKISTNSKITFPQEFDLVFYDDLRNFHDQINVVAANTSQNSSNIISLSNTIVNNYIKKINFSMSNIDISRVY